MNGMPLEKFESIEGLRAILAWWVVFAHLLQHSGFTLKTLPLFFKPLYVGIIPDHRELSLSGLHLDYSKPSQLLSAMHYFLVGMYTYAFLCRLSLTRLSALFGVGILLFTFYHCLMDPRPLRWLVLPLWIFMVALLLWRDSTLSRFFSCSVLKYLGDISYSTYLLHIFVVGTTAYLLKPFVQAGWLYFLTLSSICIPLIAVISSISYHFIERPAISWAKKKAQGLPDE